MGKYQINREVSYHEGPVIELKHGETGIIRHVGLEPTNSVIYYQQPGSPLDHLSLDGLINLDEDQLRILATRYHLPIQELEAIKALEEEYRGTGSKKTEAKRA